MIRHTTTIFSCTCVVLVVQIFFTFWQGFLLEVLHSVGVLNDIGGWDSQHVVDGLQDFLISLEMVFFAIAHRYAFPHTDYIHYLRRHKRQSTPGRSRKGSNGPLLNEESETIILFDSENNAVSEAHTVDVEYEPPTMRQLDRPMSVSRALLGVLPNETMADIARMGMSGSVTVGEGNSGTRGSTGISQGNDIVFSREHAEGI